jgi:hypothetical protein
MDIEDQGLRIRALELAQVHWAGHSPSSDDIVKTARKFYEFMTVEETK